MSADNNKILVVGGGMSGLTAAIEAAEAGAQVIIAEKEPYLGGRVAQLHRYFPKLCPPTCGLEIQFRRIRENPRITYHTMAEVTQVSGSAGEFEVTVQVKPRFVNDRCVACNACAEACPAWRVNDFNFGLDKTKAAYLPFDMAFPQKYVIDMSACTGDCGKKRAQTDTDQFNLFMIDIRLLQQIIQGQHRRRRVAARLQRIAVHERLEGRAGLTLRLGGPIQPSREFFG